MPDEITEIQLWRSLRRSRVFSWLAFVFAISGTICTWIAWPSSPKPVEWKIEQTGPSVVRYYNSGSRELLVESVNGNYQKMLYPACSQEIGVWNHEFVNITFHWAPYRQWHSGRGPTAGEECYELDKIERLGADK